LGCEVTDEGGEDLAQKSPQPPEDEAGVVAGGGEIGIDVVSKAKKRSDIVPISSALPLKADVAAVGRESPKLTRLGHLAG